MVFMFNYVDGEVYASWSAELLDCVFGKTDMNFYDYSALNLRVDKPVYYGCDKTILMMIHLAVCL